MMGINWRWLLAAIFLYCCFLIAYIPANQVIGRLNLAPEIILSNVSGTIWQGEADRAVVNNIPVNHLQWDISLWSVFTGQLTVQLDAGNMRDPASIAFTGPVSVSLIDSDNIAAEDFLLYLPVDRVLAEVKLPVPVDAGGRFRVNIETLEFEQDKCQEMMAYGDWLNATVAGTQGPIQLGNFSAKVRCEQQNFIVNVEEPNSFGLTLTATASADMNNISVQGRFKPDPNLPAEVHEAALFFGQPGADGYTTFKL